MKLFIIVSKGKKGWFSNFARCASLNISPKCYFGSYSNLAKVVLPDLVEFHKSGVFGGQNVVELYFWWNFWGIKEVAKFCQFFAMKI